MRVISVSQGNEALVDDQDYELLARWKWCVKKSSYTSYAQRRFKRGLGGLLYMHTEIMRPSLGEEVDHLNRNGLDNRRSNLRVCSHAQNTCNGRFKADNTSGYKGVTWDKLNFKWISQIGFEGKHYNLGRFSDKLEAAYAYDAKARELHGEFASLNFPNVGERGCNE